MQSETKSWITSALPLLTGTIVVLATNLFEWASNEHFQKFAEIMPYKPLLTICLLLLCAILSLAIYFSQKVRRLSAILSSQSIDATKSPSSEKELAAKRMKLLRNLSKEEKEYLKQYLDGETKTQYSHWMNGVPSGLTARGVLFCPNTMMYDSEVTYNISDWAWELLKQSPKFLK